MGIENLIACAVVIGLRIQEGKNALETVAFRTANHHIPQDCADAYHSQHQNGDQHPRLGVGKVEHHIEDYAHDQHGAQLTLQQRQTSRQQEDAQVIRRIAHGAKGLIGVGQAARHHQDDADFDKLGRLNGTTLTDGNPRRYARNGLRKQRQNQQAYNAIVNQPALNAQQLIWNGHQKAQNDGRNKAENGLPRGGAGIKNVIQYRQIRALIGIKGGNGDAVHAENGQRVGDNQQRDIQMRPRAAILRGGYRARALVKAHPFMRESHSFLLTRSCLSGVSLPQSRSAA